MNLHKAVFVLALLVALPANAELIYTFRFDEQGIRYIPSRIPIQSLIPADARFVMQRTDLLNRPFFDQVIQWDIPAVSPSDVGRVWTLDQSNAGNFHVDWPKFEGYAREYGSPTFNTQYEYYLYADETIGAGSNLGWPGPAVRIVDVERMEFELFQYELRPIDNGVHQAFMQAEWRLFGTVVPEPSTLLLAFTALVGIGIRRFRSK